MFYSLAAFGQTGNFSDQPLIETSAYVDTLVVPDEIYLTIVISETDTKGKSSLEKQESQMEKKLNQLGINTKEDLALNDLASNFKKYFLKDRDVLKSKEYTLKVDNAVTAGRVILELEKIEISNVMFDRAEFSGIDRLKLELKSAAIARARKQAEYLVAPLNQKVGPAIYIYDQAEYRESNVLYGKTAGLAIRAQSSFNDQEIQPADIEFERIKVGSGVSVKFKLEQ